VVSSMSDECASDKRVVYVNFINKQDVMSRLPTLWALQKEGMYYYLTFADEEAEEIFLDLVATFVKGNSE